MIPQNCCQTWSQILKFFSLGVIPALWLHFFLLHFSTGVVEPEMCDAAETEVLQNVQIWSCLSWQPSPFVTPNQHFHLCMVGVILINLLPTEFCICGKAYMEFWSQQIKISQCNQGQIKKKNSLWGSPGLTEGYIHTFLSFLSPLTIKPCQLSACQGVLASQRARGGKTFWKSTGIEMLQEKTLAYQTFFNIYSDQASKNKDVCLSH